MTTFADVLARQLRADSSRPLITFYDDATGERVELSVTTYANWVAKVASLLVEETVTCVVQVAGKVRDRLEVSPTVSDADLEAAALAAPGVERTLDGRGVRKVIVRAPKLVNIVPA